MRMFLSRRPSAATLTATGLVFVALLAACGGSGDSITNPGGGTGGGTGSGSGGSGGTGGGGTGGTGGTGGGSASVSTVTVSPSPDTLYSFVVDTMLKRVQLAVSLKDASGNAVTGVPVTFASSNEAVATVDANGLVHTTPVDTLLYQSATITATAGGKSGTTNIVVYRPPPATLTISPTTVTMSVGDTLTPTVEAYDAKGRHLCCRIIQFDQGTPANIVSVTAGKIKALASGTTTVRYGIEGVITSIAVTVR